MNSVVRNPSLPAGDSEAMWASLPTFFRQAAEPLRPWLQSPDVIEICCNRPGEIWVEERGQIGMKRHVLPQLDKRAVENLARIVAGSTDQNVNAERPLLSAAMPGRERFQAVLAPVAYDGCAFAIRKQVITDMSLEQYRMMGGFDHVVVSGDQDAVPEQAGAGLSALDRELVARLQDQSPEGIQDWLRFAVKNRVSMIISGGTASGKTTLLNGLLKEIPETERLVSIEDTAELRPTQPNYLRLVASKGGQGRAATTIQDCLEACLRLRPDRIMMGEIRGAEAYSFLQAINTGHPGSISTLHADSPYLAYERLAMMVMQAGLGLTKDDLVRFVRYAVPVIVQIARNPETGKRGVSGIYFNKWRGQSDA
uniref:Type IV secretion system protein n=1 Tax=Ochrobactrum sp. LM19 TaxID=1449781 RepID=A0A0D5A0S3_9HYPH|nr:P-type DNA transfer ATPase VirB11 [Ochrobactrum sp. LM19]AJW30009.1 type IV secretion protein VirB11 [Ochrobactrum sp. LM19]